MTRNRPLALLRADLYREACDLIYTKNENEDVLHRFLNFYVRLAKIPCWRLAVGKLDNKLLML